MKHICFALKFFFDKRILKYIDIGGESDSYKNMSPWSARWRGNTGERHVNPELDEDLCGYNASIPDALGQECIL